MDSSLDLPPLQISALLRAHQLHPKKGLGQNFLADPIALQRIVDAAEVQPDAHVLEVGPGLGSLTRYLARVAEQVVAVEIDQTLLPVLQEVLAPFDNVRVVQGDILQLNPAELMPESGYQVVANIPYYITSAVIRHLLEAPVKPARIVLTVQREVAERITAGTGKLSLLALSVQVYGKPRTVVRIPAGAFYPSPKVDSAVVRVDLYPEPVIPIEQLNTFFRLAKAGFSQKRKMLRNSLVGGLSLPQERVEGLLTTADIDPQRRAETLALDEWRRLTEAYDKIK
jgi:16S rRNA (adenine1518-N6/adenine1519-N6)-dimethyltransferase